MLFRSGNPGTTIPYDMGGYYINALIQLLGPVKRVSGYSRFFSDRTYSHPLNEKYGMPIATINSPSMVMGCLEFHNGTYGNLVVMGEGHGPEIPRVEIYGTAGTLICPDPNMFGGYTNAGTEIKVYMTRSGNDGVFEVPMSHGFGDFDPAIPALTGKREACFNSRRGVGVADMAWALRTGRTPRCSDELALHAVEIVTSIEKSCANNVVYELTTKPEQPRPLKQGFYNVSDMEASLDC